MRRLDQILQLIDPDPAVPFDARELVSMLADHGTVLEVQPRYGASIVTALARLGGASVALLANNPALPVVFLTDNPGVLPGSSAERAGTLRHAARMFVAQHRLAVPKLQVTLRKAFGFGSSIMAMNPFDGQTLSLACPRPRSAPCRRPAERCQARSGGARAPQRGAGRRRAAGREPAGLR